MKNLILAISLISTASAETLNDYRNCYFKSPSTVKASANSRVAGILQKLEMGHLPDIGINFPENSGEKKRVSYSNIMKTTLADGINKAIEKFETQAPLSIDPSLTVGEFETYKKQVRAYTIIEILNDENKYSQFATTKIINKDGTTSKPKVNQSALTGVDALVNDFEHAAKLKAAKDKRNKKNKKRSFPTGADHYQIAKKLKAYIIKHGGVNAQGKNIVEIFGGHITSVEVDDGKINEIQFNKFAPLNMVGAIDMDNTPYHARKSKISAQLNMFLTSKIGEEEIYVEVQDALESYLQAQKALFEQRLPNIGKELSADSENLTEYNIAVLAVNDRAVNRNSKVENIEEAKTLFLNEIKNPDVGENLNHLVRKINLMYEGKTSLLAGDSEVEFISRRINAMKRVGPYLEGMVGTTRYTHNALNKLSYKQVNFLTAFFLKLRGDDVVSKTESMQLKEIFDYAESGKKCNIVNKSDRAFYALQSNLLNNLDKAIDEREMSYNAHKQIIKDIRNGEF